MRGLPIGDRLRRRRAGSAVSAAPGPARRASSRCSARAPRTGSPSTAAGSPCLARSASFALTGKISGLNPSSDCALVGDEARDLGDLRLASRMSILLTTSTTFLPQPRTCSRNARSVSVKGRSAEVTNRTRSERGTNSAVMRSCSRMTALVPGVSTMWMSRRSGAGAVMTCRSGIARPVRSGVSPYCSTLICAVVGVTPSSTIALPTQRVDERALAGVELADDDEQEQLVELFDRAVERTLLIRRGVVSGERRVRSRARSFRSSRSSSSWAALRASPASAGRE